MKKTNDEISYDFSTRMFEFIHSSNNNIAQYFLMSQSEKETLIKILLPFIEKTSDNKYIITML